MGDLVEQEKKLMKETLDSCIASAKDAPAQVLVIKDKNLNASKLVKGISGKLKKKSFMLLVKTSNSVGCAISVDKAHQEKLDANRWFGEISGHINGRGGGKKGNVAGTGSNVEGFDP